MSSVPIGLVGIRDGSQKPQEPLLKIGKLVGAVQRRIAVEIDPKPRLSDRSYKAMDRSSTGPFVRLWAVAGWPSKRKS